MSWINWLVIFGFPALNHQSWLLGSFAWVSRGESQYFIPGIGLEDVFYGLRPCARFLHIPRYTEEDLKWFHTELLLGTEYECLLCLKSMKSKWLSLLLSFYYCARGQLGTSCSSCVLCSDWGNNWWAVETFFSCLGILQRPMSWGVYMINYKVKLLYGLHQWREDRIWSSPAVVCQSW